MYPLMGHGTTVEFMKRVGVRCGHPAPLRLPFTLKLQLNASAWRAGCPHRTPASGGATKHLIRSPMRLRKFN